MYSIMITVISIAEVAEMASGISRRQISKQEKFIRDINARKLKNVYRCKPQTGPPAEVWPKDGLLMTSSWREMS